MAKTICTFYILFFDDFSRAFSHSFAELASYGSLTRWRNSGNRFRIDTFEKNPFFLEKNFNSIHLVLPNLYGPRDHFDIIRSHALGALIRKVVDAKLKNQKTVEIWGTGSPIREWMYVENAAEGIVVATEKYNEIDILNLGCQQV